MEIIFHKTKVFALIALSALMTACLEHQIELKENETPPGPGESVSGIPEDFDYETKITRKLTVKVKDEYDGKRYYIVEVFRTNPIGNLSAELIHGAKTNKNVPFEVEIVIPKIQKQIYVRLTDPKGYKYVTEMEVGEDDLLLDYNATDTKTGAGLRSAFDQDNAADYASFFQAGMKDAEEVTAKNTNLAAGGIYKITDKNFKEKVSFPRGKFILYVGESCSLRLKDKDIELADGTEIYILEDASIDANAAEIEVGDNAKILNAGIVNLESIKMNGKSATLYNHPGGKINLSALDMDGGNVFNHCLISVSDIIFSGTGSNLYLRENSSVDVAGINFEEGHAGCAFYLKARAFLHVNKFHKQTSSYLSIYGEAGTLSFEDYPLIQIEGDMNCSNIVVYNAILLDTKGRKDGLLLMSLNAQLIDGDIPTKMQGDCYAIRNNPDDKDFTDGSEDPSYDPQDKPTQTFYYMFEDNWPEIGDYDMNDIVINVGVGNVMAGGNASKIYITGQLVAVGAKKDLYVLAQIDGTDKVINLLDGKEAHAFMGKSSGEVVNTFEQDCAPAEIFKEVDVTGMKGLVNANNLNVFIVWGDPNSEKRNEVHVAGFLGTKQAAASERSTKDYKYRSDDEYGNLMWGLMIPKESYSSYPKEGMPIKDAYPGFYDWAKAGGQNVLDWYTSGLEDKIFHLN